MAIASDDGRQGGLQRGRGGFLRRSDDTPYVTHPTKVTKAGKPANVPYASPSGLAKLIENEAALVKWQQRKAMLGLALDPALVAELARLVDMDEGSDEYNALADSIVARAKDVAEISIAADRGTHAHQLTEDSDDGRSWEQRAEAGELLGIDAVVQRQLVESWRTMLATYGLEVLAVEASVVDDVWRTAGTLDRIVRTTRELRFVRAATGEVVIVPAGTVLVLDVKTSKLNDKGNDPFTYWRGYTIQIATYAQARPYDTETGERGEWPWPIDQDHGLIARPNLTEVLDGRAERIEWTLIHADLVAGREHGGACVQHAKAWGKRTDLFATLLVDDEPEIAAPAASPSVVEQPSPETEAAPEPASAPVAPTPREQVLAVGTTPPDEGGAIDDATFEALKATYLALPEAVRGGDYKRLAEQAQQHGVEFYVNKARTVRRFEIIRGLCVLGRHDSLDDETLRALLYADDLHGEAAMFPAVTVGHLVGALNATRAAIFAERCHALIDRRLVAFIDDNGQLSLQPAA
jgi:hypothetical protein